MGWKAAAIVLWVLLSSTVGASAGTPLAARCTASPSAQDLRYVREYRHLLTARAGKVWAGWQRVPPLLRRAGHCEFLIGHPSPPRSFRKRTSGAGSWNVYAAPAGTVTPGPVATTWKVRAVWVAMVPTRGELQRALDRRFGRGVVRLTDTSYCVRSCTRRSTRTR